MIQMNVFKSDMFKSAFEPASFFRGDLTNCSTMFQNDIDDHGDAAGVPGQDRGGGGADQGTSEHDECEGGALWICTFHYLKISMSHIHEIIAKHDYTPTHCRRAS